MVAAAALEAVKTDAQASVLALSQASTAGRMAENKMNERMMKDAQISKECVIWVSRKKVSVWSKEDSGRDLVEDIYSNYASVPAPLARAQHQFSRCSMRTTYSFETCNMEKHAALWRDLLPVNNPDVFKETWVFQCFAERFYLILDGGGPGTICTLKRVLCRYTYGGTPYGG